MTDLRSALDKLAADLCKKATQEATAIEESTAIFKAAATYYAIRERIDAKKGGGDEDGDSFDAFESAINGANKEIPNGRPAQSPPGRRGN